jgi:hypothetical protein
MTHARDSADRLAGHGTRLPVKLNKANPQPSKSRELLRTAQPLRRQRRAHFGFHQCDIRGTDGAIRIHVFAEIRATDRLPHLRFSQADIGGINDGIAIHITDQHAHGNGNVAHVCTIVHVEEGNRDSLNVGYPSQIDRDL